MTAASIVIPACNEAAHLASLLQSIHHAVKFAIDIVVVDNGSADHTAEIAARFGCRVIHVSDKIYPSRARNLGAKSSDAELLAFLDADTLVTDSWANEIQRLSSDTEFLGGFKVTGDTCHISVKPSWIENYWFDPLRNGAKTYVNGANIVVSKKAFEAIDGFDEKLETGEDVDFSERAKRSGIGVELNSALKVHHEGFPRDIYNFFKREKWHGKGDLTSFSYFKKSKVALIACLLGLCYLSLFLLLPIARFSDSTIISYPIYVSLLLVLLLCATSSLVKFARLGPKYYLTGTLIYFVYFNARLASLLSVLFGSNQGSRGRLVQPAIASEKSADSLDSSR